MIDRTTSMMGRPPRPRKESTHWEKKFANKRLKWIWIKEHMPEAVPLCREVQKYFGKPEVRILIKRKKNGEKNKTV